MPKLTLEELLQKKIGKRVVAEWNERWEPLAKAFGQPHPELVGVVGLFRTVLNGETMYIVCASETKGGIAKGLQRIKGPPQTGNDGYGAQMIRKNFDRVSVDVLRVDDDQDPSKVTKLLKRVMVNLYDPHWNKPFKRRMEEIGDGTRPPD